MKGFPGSGGIKTNECQQNPGSGKAFRGHFIVPKSPNLYVYVPLLFLIMNASRAHGKSAPCHEGTNVSSVRPCPVEIWRYDSAHHAPHLRLRVSEIFWLRFCAFATTTRPNSQHIQNNKYGQWLLRKEAQEICRKTDTLFNTSKARGNHGRSQTRRVKLIRQHGKDGK